MQLPTSNVREVHFPQQFYVVICGWSDEPYTAERQVCDMTWDETVKDIADGQFENLRQVLELGTGKDVTNRMVQEAAEKRIFAGADYNHKFFQIVELHLGTRAARNLVRGVA